MRFSNELYKIRGIQSEKNQPDMKLRTQCAIFMHQQGMKRLTETLYFMQGVISVRDIRQQLIKIPQLPGFSSAVQTLVWSCKEKDWRVVIFMSLKFANNTESRGSRQQVMRKSNYDQISFFVLAGDSQQNGFDETKRSQCAMQVVLKKVHESILHGNILEDDFLLEELLLRSRALQGSDI